MTILSDILRDVLFELGDYIAGVATGGSTTTIVDSGIGGSDDDYNGGTVIITYDAGAAGAAPEGQGGEITDYASATGTITCGTTLTAAAAASDEYMASTAKWGHFQLIRAVNRALSSIGDIPLMDTTTLDTASSKTEYAVTATWKRNPPIRIDLQGVTTDANDNRWLEINRGSWEYVPAAGGSTGLIIFRDQLPIGRDLRIWYVGVHPTVRALSDYIYEGIHPEQLVWETIYRMYRWKKGMQDAPSGLEDLLMEADQRRKEFGLIHKMWKPRRKSRLLIVKREAEEDRFTYPGPA